MKNGRLERRFEGKEVLGVLLKASACPCSVDDVIFEFEAAVEDGTPPNEIVGLLWEQDPHFASADHARQTFSNLFGLYDQIAAGAVADLVQLGPPDPNAPLTPVYVDTTWLELDGVNDRERARQRDRFDNLQNALATVIFETLADQAPVLLETTMDLAFETWWILDHAGRAQSIERATLQQMLQSDDDLESEAEPALAAMADTSLWEQLADDDNPLLEQDMPTAQRVLRVVRRALTGADK